MNSSRHSSPRAWVRDVSSGIAATALAAALSVVPSFAKVAEKAPWELRSDSAYFSVYSYLCAPAFFDSVARERPDGMEVAVTESRFRVDYGSDCRAFYLAEVEPRIDLTAYGVVAMKIR